MRAIWIMLIVGALSSFFVGALWLSQMLDPNASGWKTGACAGAAAFVLVAALLLYLGEAAWTFRSLMLCVLLPYLAGITIGAAGLVLYVRWTDAQKGKPSSHSQ